jgi:hypothetical protein
MRLNDSQTNAQSPSKTTPFKHIESGTVSEKRKCSAEKNQKLLLASDRRCQNPGWNAPIADHGETILNDFSGCKVFPRFQLTGHVTRLPPERKLGEQDNLQFLGSELLVVLGGATYLSKPSLGITQCLKKLSDEFAHK